MARCHEFLNKTEAATLPQSGPFRSVIDAPDRRRCIPYQGGFFALTAKSYQEKQEGESWQIDWQIAWVVKGRIKYLRARPDKINSAANLQLKDVRTGGDDQRTLLLQDVRDLDGDGAPELFLHEEVDYYEDLPGSDLSLWTVRANHLVPYRHSPKLYEVRGAGEHYQDLLADVDGDGRLDIRTAGNYSGTQEPVCGGMDEGSAVPPVFLYHALPDGRFSDTDAVAQEELKQWCPYRPDLAELAESARQGKKTAPYSLTQDFSRVVVCARAWGASPQAVLDGIKPACAVAPAGCGEEAVPKAPRCPVWVAKLAAVPAKVLLR